MELNTIVPTPGMVTVMEVGAHPALSVYRTENVTTVDVVPAPGLAAPSESTSWCDAPWQLAAIATGAVASRAMSTPTRPIVRRCMVTICVWGSKPRRTVAPGMSRARWSEGPICVRDAWSLAG